MNEREREGGEREGGEERRKEKRKESQFKDFVRTNFSWLCVYLPRILMSASVSLQFFSPSLMSCGTASNCSNSLIRLTRASLHQGIVSTVSCSRMCSLSTWKSREQFRNWILLKNDEGWRNAGERMVFLSAIYSMCNEIWLVFWLIFLWEVFKNI